MQPTENYSIIVQELVRRSNDETRRLRNVEQRLDTIEDKLNVLLQTSADRMKKINSDIAESDVILKNLENDIINMKMALENINKQLMRFVQKRDLKEIEHMLDLIAPAPEIKKFDDIREVRVSN